MTSSFSIPGMQGESEVHREHDSWLDVLFKVLYFRAVLLCCARRSSSYACNFCCVTRLRTHARAIHMHTRCRQDFGMCAAAQCGGCQGAGDSKDDDSEDEGWAPCPSSSHTEKRGRRRITKRFRQVLDHLLFPSLSSSCFALSPAVIACTCCKNKATTLSNKRCSPPPAFSL